MKKNFLPKIAIIITLVVMACSKDLQFRTADLPALTPAKTDADAGTWKPILLSSADEFAVPVPGATTTPDYIAQVNELKAWQANSTPEERQSVKYWSAGGVLRWNEILRHLVAKYNLPPYQNPDGTYPFPSAANPLAYPFFPFANPPYAARAYAYFSAAQYDALIAAYHYKQVYNRPAPYVVDATLKPLIPASALPSYPSEDAVVAGAALEILKLLFPGDQDYINKKAEEHKRARLIAGANVRSDIEAGEALGKAVAQKFVAKARGDRAGVAAGNAAMWDKLEADCIAGGQDPWKSLELPKRPPMLPAFGKVKSMLLDSLGLVALRPGPPPSTSSEQMRKETAEIKSMTENLTRDQIAIVHKWADGLATYTPPGHWNDIAAEYFIPLNFSEVRWARNLALLNIAMMDAAIVCWDTKYLYFNPRPSLVDRCIKTITGVPNFPGYISGHSTFSGAAATLLAHVVPGKANDFMAMASEASLSRMYGGIHYRSDCETGLVVGKNIGAKAVDRAKIDGAE